MKGKTVLKTILSNPKVEMAKKATVGESLISRDKQGGSYELMLFGIGSNERDAKLNLLEKVDNLISDLEQLKTRPEYINLV